MIRVATQLGSVHRFNDDAYLRMGELGILPERGVELIDGHVVFAGGRRWRFTTEDYYRLAEHGILADDARVELIEGEILDMAPIDSRHAGSVNRLNAFLSRTVGDRAVISVQSPLHVREGVEPEPDIMLLHPRADFYTNGHPTPRDVLLLIEVADTSIGYDRTEKADLYAGAGIGEYWLVDLGRQRVFVHSDPLPTGYGNVEMKDCGDTWAARSLPNLSVSGKNIFG